MLNYLPPAWLLSILAILSLKRCAFIERMPWLALWVRNP